MTPMGAVPISFELEATTLSAAIAKFGEAAELAVQQTMRELQELRREQASSLVIPDRPRERPAESRRSAGPRPAAPLGRLAGLRAASQRAYAASSSRCERRQRCGGGARPVGICRKNAGSLEGRLQRPPAPPRAAG